ncbi:MAG TPA: dTDP-4-amino-4,6-dideoxygalactose transaminase [Chitinophagales bacterium]|nr:dTDP-4-amino-4,6-dideoxygalactose transaminase [Chitinophagales bacterium]
MKYTIPFNKPFIIQHELKYINEAVESGKISGDGVFTKRCHQFFETRYSFRKTLLTTSCTDALEMAALLIDIKPGDEVIAPSFTFVSTVNAFVLRGAKIVFVDSGNDEPCMDVTGIEALITNRTKAIVAVHYGGVACHMDPIMDLALKYNLVVVEDAAQAIDSYYNGKPLGGIGHLGAFSFHETKNVIAGEGGMLVINDKRYIERAEILREKGTNRSKFFRGEIDKYGWVDIGSSYLPSDITAAYLYAQLENLERIQMRRKEIWSIYNSALGTLAAEGFFKLPVIPSYATNNAHLFYLICRSEQERAGLINYLKNKGILAVFHYLQLHKSEYYKPYADGRQFANTDKYADCLVRLPFFYELKDEEQKLVIETITEFYRAL